MFLQYKFFNFFAVFSASKGTRYIVRPCSICVTDFSSEPHLPASATSNSLSLLEPSHEDGKDQSKPKTKLNSSYLQANPSHKLTVVLLPPVLPYKCKRISKRRILGRSTKDMCKPLKAMHTDCFGKGTTAYPVAHDDALSHCSPRLKQRIRVTDDGK